MTTRLRHALAYLAVACALRAVDKVPDFDVTDSYATGPTMLVRAGINGELREVWSGMDPKGLRHVPLFLETSIFGRIRKGDGWLDLRSLRYSRSGTRPGIVVLHSEDGQISIEITSRRNSGDCPMFVKYSFAQPVDFQLSAAFKYPQFTRSLKRDDAAGSWEFSTAWRFENPRLTTTDGPALVLATLPVGRSLNPEGSAQVKEIDGSREVLLCIDATGASPGGPPAGSYAAAWRDRAGGTADTESELVPGRVTLASDDSKLDQLFRASVDAVASSQFASGDVMADVFFYRDSWLRDGSYSMIGLALAGGHADAERYFAFWDSQRDFSVGGEREAQQPAIAITAMWLYSRLCADAPAFLAKVWDYTKYYGDYYDRRISREGMLSVSEEWICFIPAPATWPNAEIYSGLRAAAKIAAGTGHGENAARWGAAADRLQAAFLARAYDTAKGRIIPMAGDPGQVFTDPEYPKAESRNGPLRDDRVDAGMLIIGRFEALGKGQGVIGVDDPRFTSTQAEVMRDLENPDHAIFRFGPNATSPHAPGGELDTWPIIGSWAAQDEWLLGRTDLAWRYLLSGILHKANYDLEAGCWYLPENWDRKGFADKPLITWSHGEFITTTMLLFLGLDLEPEGADLGLAPSLPPGMNHAHIAHFNFRGRLLDFDLRRAAGGVETEVRAEGAGTLVLRTPSGAKVPLGNGTTARFTADPAQYYAQLGRARNAPERARVAAAILDPGHPAPDFSGATPAGIQDFIIGLETRFVPTAQ